MKTDKISRLALSFTVAGAFIGAGFVSGNELWQFFGSHGITAFLTLPLSLILLGILCKKFIYFCKRENVTSLKNCVFVKSPDIVKSLFVFSQIIFYFFLCVIMTSGFMALVKSFAGNVASLIAGIGFAVLVCICIFAGLHTLVRIFSLFVPCLIASTVIISALFLVKNGFAVPEIPQFSPKPFLSAIWGALLSVSYNFFSCIGIFAPISVKTENEKNIRFSSFLGISYLFFIGAGILLSLFSASENAVGDLPMLEIAKSLSSPLSLFYALLLAAAMFTCSVTSGICVFEWAGEKFQMSKVRRLCVCAVFSVLFYTLSLIGFSTLINTVYSFFGYIGFAVIIAVFINSGGHNAKKHQN